MNVCKVPDMCKDMEYKYITEDSKTRVYLSLVREFNKAEYEKYYRAKKKAKMKKRIILAAIERGSHEIGSEAFLVGMIGLGIFWFLSWLIGGDEY